MCERLVNDARETLKAIKMIIENEISNFLDQILVEVVFPVFEILFLLSVLRQDAAVTLQWRQFETFTARLTT